MKVYITVAKRIRKRGIMGYYFELSFEGSKSPKFLRVRRFMNGKPGENAAIASI